MYHFIISALCIFAASKREVLNMDSARASKSADRGFFVVEKRQSVNFEAQSLRNVMSGYAYLIHAYSLSVCLFSN